MKKFLATCLLFFLVGFNVLYDRESNTATVFLSKTLSDGTDTHCEIVWRELRRVYKSCKPDEIYLISEEPGGWVPAHNPIITKYERFFSDNPVGQDEPTDQDE